MATAPAQAAGPGLVINEVYGGGGNGGATLTSDFIELRNTSTDPVGLGGKSLQYRSSGGTGATGSSNVFVLPDVEVPAGETFLVKAADGAGGTEPLPEPDAESTLALSGSSGQVFLADSATAIDPNTPGGAGGSTFTAQVIDFVGYGSAGSFEGASAAPGMSSTNSVTRNAAGDDTDVNGTDFSQANPPTPTPCATCEDDPDPDPTGATIAEIQGTGAASPLVGQDVITEGVVTAAYPTGGYNGFYLQTGGTGGETDATPGASDGIFVFGITDGVSIGDSVEVAGTVAESFGLTRIEADSVTPLAEALDPVTALEAEWFATDAEREAHEGELLSPLGDYTVTNSYDTARFGEIGLALGDTPLPQPTDVAVPGSPEADAVVADNAARLVTLDDGRSTNFSGSGSDEPMSWFTGPEQSVRTGAAATFTGDVILDFRFDLWKFEPTSPLNGAGDATATFEDTRVAEPDNVGGDLKIATFNVLNYFNTTGQDWVASGQGRTCTYFNDRDGEPTNNNRCEPNGPRGAASDVSLTRQQDKIVAAINTLGADIVSLEEIENSVALGENNRNDAVSALVTALNADAGSNRWAFAPSPAAADLPPLVEQDVIRTAFIYNPATVRLVGGSQVLTGNADFANAREPLAQAFKERGAPNDTAFGVIVNHFKSKGCSDDAVGDNADTEGTGCFNGDRERQAQGLVDFADAFKADTGVTKMFLVGDFNAYTQESPMQVLYDAGYGKIESDTAGETSYTFQGLVGSLDHILADSVAASTVTGSDIWDINADEPVGYEYSRFNNNVTNLYDTSPFRASDHDPQIVGVNPGDVTKQVQVLATNDFHGRIANDSFGDPAGAAIMAGAVKQLRAANPNTVFAAAGDLIGASTFESFIANDKPTIDALNEAGLEVSAVGNHEFDQGYDDLVDRVMAPFDPETNPQGGAEWAYIGANVRFRDSGDPALEGTWMKEMDGVQVGFVGAVTEHLDELVAPDGIAEIETTDIVEATNTAADELVAEGADAVVLLVHEGAPSTECATMDDDPTSDFGSIITGVNDNVDAIVSGHTHLAYDCSFPVAGWADRPVTERPVVSAGQYGANLNQLEFTFDLDNQVVAVDQAILDMKTGQDANYPTDPATQEIVDEAVAEAEVLGAEPLGEIGGPFSRAKLANGTQENRGGESTLGNLVAEVQRYATESETTGSAQIAFMNPGGLRADMSGLGTGDFPRTLTFKQAATVQPFANTLVNMDLTGAQIRQVLEEQWQPEGSSRPFLRLGVSEGFHYTYDPDAAAGERITGMWLDGVAIDDATSYSVTVNSFLSSGGDNFGTLAEGSDPQDTGQTDLQAMVDYMAEFAADEPLEVDYSQRAVGVDFGDEAPETYAAGDDVTFDLSSLSMTGEAAGVSDVVDTEVTVSLGETDLGTFPVTTTEQTALPGFDEVGTATAEVTLPEDAEDGAYDLVVTGADTGTEVTVPITVDSTVESPATVTATITPEELEYRKDTGRIDVIVSSDLPVAPTGDVELIFDGTTLDTATLVDGEASFAVGRLAVVGSFELTVAYPGDELHEPAEGTVTLKVVKQTPKVKVQVPKQVKVGKRAQVQVRVTGVGAQPAGRVVFVFRGQEFIRKLDGSGRAKMKLPAVNRVGKFNVKAKYEGSSTFTKAKGQKKLKVKK